MESSSQINELAAALAEARKAFGTFGKSHTAKVSSVKGSYEYKYGDLADLFEATTPALSAVGLTLSQWPDVTDGGRFVLVTWLLHKSGQWMRGHYPLNTYERPQEQGSALTYAKRYAAAAALGISAEMDDDGAAAQAGKPLAPLVLEPPLERVDEATGEVQPVDRPTPASGTTYIVRYALAQGRAGRLKGEVTFTDGKTVKVWDAQLSDVLVALAQEPMTAVRYEVKASEKWGDSLSKIVKLTPVLTTTADALERAAAVDAKDIPF